MGCRTLPSPEPSSSVFEPRFLSATLPWEKSRTSVVVHALLRMSTFFSKRTAGTSSHTRSSFATQQQAQTQSITTPLTRRHNEMMKFGSHTTLQLPLCYPCSASLCAGSLARRRGRTTAGGSRSKSRPSHKMGRKRKHHSGCRLPLRVTLGVREDYCREVERHHWSDT